MSFAADDIVRVRELGGEGFSACAIQRYMNDISLGTVRNILGRQQANVLSDDRLSVRQRARYLNWVVIS